MLRTAQIALVSGLFSLVLSIIGSLTATAATASFDCSKASTKVGKAICGDDKLAKLDYQLGQAYQKADRAVPASDQAGLIASQRIWLRNRDGDCNAPNYDYEACLAIIYQGRLAALSGAAKGDQRSLDNLLWTDGIACRDNQALIRFSGTVEDDSVPANDPPNVGGSLRHAPAQAHQQCRLRDGRVVRYKVASMDDAEPFGPCGAQEDQIYSVWIGNKKVINREQRAGKCDSNPVRAIYFDGSHLTRCSDEREWYKEDSVGTHSCSDISASTWIVRNRMFPRKSF